MPGFVQGIHDFLSLKSRKVGDEPQALNFTPVIVSRLPCQIFSLSAFGMSMLFDDAQRFARVHGALLGIERAVGREHDLVEIVEGKAGVRCRHAAEHRGVGVERVLEVIEWPLLQALEN